MSEVVVGARVDELIVILDSLSFAVKLRGAGFAVAIRGRIIAGRVSGFESVADVVMTDADRE